MKKLNYAIVITGIIGSGKSSVCSLLKLYGYKIIDADEISHEVLESSTKEICQILGDDILKDGKIDRGLLGEKVFNDAKSKKILENILHPKIYSKIYEIAQSLESKAIAYFIDIPLFFEVGGREKYNVSKVLLVTASKQTCLKRIIKRDGISRDLALKKLESQIDIESKKKLSDWVINNDATLKELGQEVEQIVAKIKNKA